MTKCILVIDDDEAIRIVLKASLSCTVDWKILVADSAKKGLLLAQAEQPDAILLDVRMPDIDGITLFHQLQSHPPTQRIPTIFLTGQMRAAEHETLKALGGAGIISKPFEPTKIAHQIQTLLNWI